MTQAPLSLSHGLIVYFALLPSFRLQRSRYYRIVCTTRRLDTYSRPRDIEFRSRFRQPCRFWVRNPPPHRACVYQRRTVTDTVHSKPMMTPASFCVRRFARGVDAIYSIKQTSVNAILRVYDLVRFDLRGCRFSNLCGNQSYNSISFFVAYRV